MRLIDADELKALYDDPEFAGEKWHVPILVILANIDDMPTIDPVKHGRWVGVSDSEATPRCSNCGRRRFGSSLGYAMKYVPYCEKCGARMDEEAER